MIGSHANFRSTTHIGTTANSAPKLTVAEQAEMAFEREQVLPGSYDDSGVVRGLLIQSIKRSGLSRASIADEMSVLLGRNVTESMLNAFTADRGDRRWPADFDRAFCKATGDYSLITSRVQMAGLHVIDSAELDLLELGRAFLQRTQADEKIALLQKRLAGVAA